MENGKRGWLIAAASLILIGLVLFAVGMAAHHWDLDSLSTDEYETNSYELGEAFTDIRLDTATADIFLTVSEDDTCKVVCFESVDEKHSVAVQNGTLTVSASDTKEWYQHIGIHTHSPEITLYLPRAEYASLVIRESTGDVRIEDISTGTLEISLSTGDILIEDSSAETLKISVSTGEVYLKDVSCRELLSDGSTGDMTLKNVIASGMISVERSTGSVYFDSSDAAELRVTTSTGDVGGTLLSEKLYIAESSTGDIRVPKTGSGGKCEITTSTGDISMY